MVSSCNPTAQIKDTSNEFHLPLMHGVKFVSGDTPLHIACKLGKVAIIKHLLKTGHKDALKVFNKLQELTFHIACSRSQATVARLFVEWKKCFDCNALNTSEDSPLHMVCKKGDSNISFVGLLVNTMKCRTDVVDKVGNLPLHIVCQRRLISQTAVKILSTRLNGHQLALQNSKGNTALHELLIMPHNECSTMKYSHLQEIVQFLAGRMSNLAISINTGKQPIHLACHHHRLNVVKYVCEHYISQSLELPPTVLHEACLNDRKGVLLYLIENFNLDVNIPNTDGDLPLHLTMHEKWGVKEAHTSCMLKNVNHTNNEGNTPLHELCSGSIVHNGYERSNVLRTLLKMSSISISVQNNKGRTPLHCIYTAENLRLREDH